MDPGKKVYERGTFSVKNVIQKGEELNLGAESPILKILLKPPTPVDIFIAVITSAVSNAT